MASHPPRNPPGAVSAIGAFEKPLAFPPALRDKGVIIQRYNTQPTFTDLAISHCCGPRTGAFLDTCNANIPFDRLAQSVANIFKTDPGKGWNACCGRGGWWRGCVTGGCGQKELTPEQKRFNKIVAPIRAFMEHPYAWIKGRLNNRRVRFRGLAANAFDFAMSAIAWNFCRIYSLKLAVALVRYAGGRCAPREAKRPRRREKSGRKCAVLTAWGRVWRLRRSWMELYLSGLIHAHLHELWRGHPALVITRARRPRHSTCPARDSTRTRIIQRPRLRCIRQIVNFQ